MIDLERLANHKGSAFGRVGATEPQPSNEQFANLCATALHRTDK